MRRSDIRPRGLYAVQGADRVVVPAVVLDRALWDRLPGEGEVVYRPAPEGELWSTTLDRDTGARRGILTVLPRSGTKVTKSLVASLKRLAERAGDIGVPGGGERAVAELDGHVADPLGLTVVRNAKVIAPWEKYAAGESLHSCPVCGELVAMNAASRLRAHGGVEPCPRSNKPL
ncbi:hypothetical protein [Streptomyces sp. NPDC088752]|uniref:hypothetical protein n=1 Tax=Streptomyces sp. NPDC088752 TaxID=3154963 RepID=UPI0034403C2F